MIGPTHGEPAKIDMGHAVVAEPQQRAFTPRAFVIALLFAVMGCWWVVQTSVIRYSVHVGGSVPPIPAVTALLLLALVNPRLGRWALRRGEILLIYIMVAVAVVVPDPNSLLLYLLAFVTAPHYFTRPERGYNKI